MSNVHILPARPLHDLLPCLRAFDVCIIPYVIDELNLYCSPVKLYMYLATGKPIVSVDIPGVVSFREVVRIGTNYAEFEQHVAEAIGENGERLRQRRIELFKKNTWEKRAETVLAAIDSTLKHIG